jgi:hypothetical protein
MEKFDAHKDRTALRLKLHDNGFTPIPNHNKACFLEGWSTVDVTPELIRSKRWARSRAWPDTGLRCGQIIGVDWDINDKTLLNDLLDAAVADGVISDSPYVRIGKAPRELWVFRTDEKIGKRTTGAFKINEDTEEEKVEILGGGCQFAAFGQRDADTPYTWPEESLLDISYYDLPEITLEQVDALIDYSIAFFEERGLIRHSPMAGTDGGYITAYDLTLDMEFDVQHQGMMTLEEIAGYLHDYPEDTLRCTVDALRPTSGSWAGMISLVYDSVCLSDHGTYTAHFLESESLDKTTATLGERLGPLIEAAEAARASSVREETEKIIKESGDDLNTTDKLDVNLTRALQRFVYVKTDGLVCDVRSAFLTNSVPVFRHLTAPYYEVKDGPRGGEVYTNLSDLWLRHPDRLEAESMQLRPDKEMPTYTDQEGYCHLNTYRPVDHSGTGGDAKVGIDMLRALLPLEEEYHYFRQWLAFKIGHPEVPGPAIVMVAADSYGTGRGSLITLLSDVFGERYIERISFETLAGHGSQSQYNEWLVDNLIVAVDEAKEATQANSKWQARQNAYEQLKSVIDPASRELQIKRKGIKNGKARTFASVIIATNHSDALVVPRGDRRLAVLENGKPMPQDYWDRFHAWRGNPSNVSAFVREIKTTSLAGYNPYASPPMTRSKVDMVDAGESGLDRAVRHVFNNLDGLILTKEQFNLKLEAHVHDEHLGDAMPEGWTLTAVGIFKKKTRILAGGENIVVEGRKREARLTNDCEQGRTFDNDSIIIELEKNGPQDRAMPSNGKVVGFPQRN